MNNRGLTLVLVVVLLGLLLLLVAILAPGMPKERSQDPTQFTAEKNAWAMFTGVDDSLKDGAPVLWTANIGSNPDHFEPMATGTDIPYLTWDGIPFGDRGAVIVLNGGSAFTVRPDSLTTNSFNAVGATNQCLYPE